MPDPLEVEVPRLFTLDVFYTGDIHCNIENVKRLSTVIKQARSKITHSLLVDTGDWSAGGVLCERFQGKPMVDIMNHLQYDAAGIGEDECEWGLRILEARAAEASFPLLCANLKAGSSSAIKPYIIKEVGGPAVALIGVTRLWKDPGEGILLRDPERAIADALRAVEKKNPAFLILVSHLGLETDCKIAARFPRFHVILGGHSHDRLEHPEKIGDTLIAHCGKFGEYLGHLTLEVGGKLTIG